MFYLSCQSISLPIIVPGGAGEIISITNQCKVSLTLELWRGLEREMEAVFVGNEVTLGENS